MYKRLCPFQYVASIIIWRDPDWLYPRGGKVSSSYLLPLSSLKECVRTISVVPDPLSFGKLLIMSFAPGKSEGMEIFVSRSLLSMMVSPLTEVCHAFTERTWFSSYIHLTAVCEKYECKHTIPIPGGYSWKFLVGVYLPVLQILTWFQTKKCNFPHPFSD